MDIKIGIVDFSRPMHNFHDAKTASTKSTTS